MSGARIAVGALLLAHVAVAAAGFVAPYHPEEQARAVPLAPPTRLHLVDDDGNLHARPFVYAWRPAGVDGGYVEDTSRMFPVRLFAGGRLFGVDPPARISLLGTDALGRDVLSRLLYGGRFSLLIGLLATLCSLTAGVVLGSVAGLHGRWVDHAIMRAADVFLSVPWLYLLVAVRAALPLDVDPREAFVVLVLLIGAIGWARPARLVRGIVLTARERTFVAAARGLGASRAYLLRHHVLPQAYGVLLVQAVVLIPNYVLAEVTLSFVGLGVAEPAPSWGNMLAGLQQFSVLTSCWWMFAPAAALVAVTFTYHTVASAIHERLGPAAA